MVQTKTILILLLLAVSAFSCSFFINFLILIGKEGGWILDSRYKVDIYHQTSFGCQFPNLFIFSGVSLFHKKIFLLRQSESKPEVLVDEKKENGNWEDLSTSL